MEEKKKKWLGLATFWPFAYILVFVLFIFGMIFLGNGGGEPVMGLLFLLFMVVHFLTVFLILGLQIYYIIHAVKNDDLTQNSKVLWIVGFFLAGLFAMPVYWYVAIWKAADDFERRELESGGGFESAYDRETDFSQQRPREPHSWR